MSTFFRNPFKNKFDMVDVVIILLLSAFITVIGFFRDMYGYSLLAFIGICGCYIDLFVADKMVRTICLAILLMFILGII